MLEQFLQEIQNADTDGILVTPPPNLLSGFSGDKVIGLLQRLCNLFSGRENVSYAEIGVYRGLTLLSVALSCQEMPCYGIDTFTHFNPLKQDLAILKKRIAQLDLNNVRIIDEDFEKVFEDPGRKVIQHKIAVLFLDGPHDYRGQRMSLELALPYLHEQAVIVVDDCNYEHVRQANKDFLMVHSEYKLLFEAYTRSHPNNMNHLDREEVIKGWWNGINILVRDRANRLERMFPPTGPREVFENDHIVHAARFSKLAPDALRLLRLLHPLKLGSFIRECRRMRCTLQQCENSVERKMVFDEANTYSDDLAKINYNRLKSA